MKTSWIVGIIVVLIIIFGGWYWYSQSRQGSYQPQSSAPAEQQPSTATAAPSTAAAANIVLTSATDSRIGNYLAASNGMTLYTYAKDKTGVSNCAGTCAVNWPPYSTASASGLALSVGLSGALGTLTRSDASIQITYNGHPLYFFKNDKKPGDTAGEGVLGVWFVAKP